MIERSDQSKPVMLLLNDKSNRHLPNFQTTKVNAMRVFLSTVWDQNKQNKKSSLWNQ